MPDGIPRDPVTLTDRVPAWSNPGWLLNGSILPEGRSRRCEPCDVRWHGEDPCWACGGAA